MNRTEQNQLTAAWAAYAAFYRIQLADEVLKMYAEDLADLDYAQVAQAMVAFRRNPKNRFMPMPADIRGMLQPLVDNDSAAREIAARVVHAVTQFGWCNGITASEYIGEVGWQAVNRQGGWTHICQNLGVGLNEGVFQAHIRDLIKGQLAYPQAAMEEKIGLNPPKSILIQSSEQP